MTNTEPFWRSLVKQSNLEQVYNAAKGNSKNDERACAFGLARYAEACIYMAADRYIEAVEVKYAAAKAEIVRLQTELLDRAEENDVA